MKPAVEAARTHLEKRRALYDAEVVAPLDAYRAQLSEWEELTLFDVHASRRGRKEADVRETVDEQQRLLDSLQTTGEPLLRVLAVLIPTAPDSGAIKQAPVSSAISQDGHR
ncbi:hypothetical protein ACFQX6_55245 [Streptosporangium lutulentum]